MQPGATLIFLDTSVIYPRTLRDWFCLLSLNSGIEGIELRWSEDVLAEFIYNRRREEPGASDAQIGQWRQRLTDSFPNAIVSNYSIDPMFLEGEDKFDAHVLAAAIHGRVDYLVTSNISDFEGFADSVEFEILTPDDMLCLIEQRRPDAVSAATKKQCNYWSKREGSKSLHDALVDSGAPNFAQGIRKRLSQWALSGRY